MKHVLSPYLSAVIASPAFLRLTTLLALSRELSDTRLSG